MQIIKEREKQVLVILAQHQRMTLTAVGKTVGRTYRGIQDLVARLCQARYLVRAGHGRGQRLLLTAAGTSQIGELPQKNVHKPKRGVAPIRHVAKPYTEMTRPELLDEFRSLSAEFPEFAGKVHPAFIYEVLCVPLQLAIREVLRRWPELGVDPGIQIFARDATNVTHTYFAVTCASRVRDPKIVQGLYNLIGRASPKQLAEFYDRLGGNLIALDQPEHMALIAAGGKTPDPRT